MGRPRLTLEDARAAAKAHGGECLAGEGDEIRSQIKLPWRCGRCGHEWRALLASVRNTPKHKGTWCRKCAGGRGRPPLAPGEKTTPQEGKKLGRPALTLADAHAEAAKNGGKCLSTEYTVSSAHLQWECAEGHAWKATMASVRNIGTWCPHCGHKRRENSVRKFLEGLLEKASDVRRPRWTRTRDTPVGLELDIWYPGFGFAIEVQGEQHRSHVEYFHPTKEMFEAQKRRDVWKKELCEDNWTVLLEVWPEDDAEVSICSFLADLGISTNQNVLAEA